MQVKLHFTITANVSTHYNDIITSAKEGTKSPISDCLFVCLSMHRLCETFASNFQETFHVILLMKKWQMDRHRQKHNLLGWS